VLAALSVVSTACGKKGPPLPPIVHLPAAVEQIEARRRGNDVAITVTVPSKNIDGSVPVDIERIEVFGYTGTSAPPRGRFLEVATLAATLTIPQPKPGADPAARPAPENLGEPFPGGTSTLLEKLTPETLVARPIPPSKDKPRQPALPPAASPTPTEEGPLRRFYMALPYSPRGRQGPPSPVFELRLTSLPDPPPVVMATHDAEAVRVEWEPSGGLIGFLLDRTLPRELSPLDVQPSDASATSDAAGVIEGPTRYNVYRHGAAPEIEQAGGRAPAPAAPTLITPTPLDTLTVADPLSRLDGRERCYVVTAVRGTGAQAVEGDPSTPPACVTPVDMFAPRAPSGLSTVSGEGAITLIWEPNTELDVAGYLILRGEAGDATLTPVTDTVVTEARFIDRTVKPGVRYLYAVQAIDTRLPTPNVSVESARVEETAR
jgi:hypothetical protein